MNQKGEVVIVAILIGVIWGVLATSIFHQVSKPIAPTTITP